MFPPPDLQAPLHRPDQRVRVGIRIGGLQPVEELPAGDAGVGLAAARAEGRIGGRRPKLTPAQRADVVENVASGRRTATQMARLYKVSEPTVSRILAAARAAGTTP